MIEVTEYEEFCKSCGAYWVCEHKRRRREIEEKLIKMLQPQVYERGETPIYTFVEMSNPGFDAQS